MPPHSAKIHSAPWCPQSRESSGQPSSCAWHGVVIPAEVGRPEETIWDSCEVHSAHERKNGKHDGAEEWPSQGFTPGW